MADLDLDDIQGLIARGYPDLNAARYVLLQIDDATTACRWLGGLADQVTPGPTRPAEIALNVAVTASGLKKLGLPESALAMFSNEFTAGMSTPHRRRILGDVGPNAPEGWLWGGPNTPAVDLLLLQFARDNATLDQLSATISGTFANGGVSEVKRLDATISLDGKEHFGFADGISQPTIAGLSSRRDIPANTVKPGEFILGYVNEYGLYTARPLLDSSADPGHLLAPDAEGSGRADLARNGSYVVFRQLAQDVRAFWHFVDQATGRRMARVTRTGARGWPPRWSVAGRAVRRWPSRRMKTIRRSPRPTTLRITSRMSSGSTARSVHTCGGRIRATRWIPLQAPRHPCRWTDATGCCDAAANTGHRSTTSSRMRRRTTRIGGCTLWRSRATSRASSS